MQIEIDDDTVSRLVDSCQCFSEQENISFLAEELGEYSKEVNDGNLTKAGNELQDLLLAVIITYQTYVGNPLNLEKPIRKWLNN